MLLVTFFVDAKRFEVLVNELLHWAKTETRIFKDLEVHVKSMKDRVPNNTYSQGA